MITGVWRLTISQLTSLSFWKPDFLASDPLLLLPKELPLLLVSLAV